MSTGDDNTDGAAAPNDPESAGRSTVAAETRAWMRLGGKSVLTARSNARQNLVSEGSIRERLGLLGDLLCEELLRVLPRTCGVPGEQTNSSGV